MTQESYQLFIGERQTQFADENNKTHDNIATTIFDIVDKLYEYTRSIDYQGKFSTVQYPTSVTRFYHDLYNYIQSWTWTDGEWDTTLLDVILMSETCYLTYSDHYLSYVITFEIKEEYIDEEE